MNVFLAIASLVIAMPIYAHDLPPVIVARNVQVNRFYGFARALGSNRYLYTTVNERRYQGDRWLGGTTIFYAPDGRRLGSEVLEFSKSPFIPLYRLDVPGAGYIEGVRRITADSIYLFRKKSGAASLRTRKIRRAKNLVVGAGLRNFIRNHFPALSSGRRMHIRLLDPMQLRAFSYTISRLPDGVCDGEQAVRFKVDRSSLLHFLAGRPMIFDVIPASRRICQYRGVSDLRNPKTGRRYHVRIDYSRRPPPGAPPSLPPL